MIQMALLARWAFKHGSCSRYPYWTCTCCQLWGAGSVCGGERGPPSPCWLGPTEEARTPYGAKGQQVALERPLGLALEASSFSSVT